MEELSRRQVIAGTGAVLAAGAVAGCSVYGKKNEEPSVTVATSAGQSAPANAVASTSQVPVGSGLIVGDKGVVVTQLTAGDFKGLSSTCTHAGCTVAEISDNLIHCPCHGSAFNLDGTVAHGPAAKPLPAKNVSVSGDFVVLD